ncbi:hypothetical protein [Microbulbifer variabilis]|uniref:hypothetical protein n=1 Tax=Microbulbifer variabilis TaxID=266805 RepID=UPI001CFE061C|nr:hypothetical protein [Microbulbifer variabilis]
MKSEKLTVGLLIVAYAIIGIANFLMQYHLGGWSNAVRNFAPYLIFPVLLLLSLNGRAGVKLGTLFFVLLLGILSIYGIYLRWSEYVFGERAVYSIELLFYFSAAILLYKIGYLTLDRGE